MYLVTNSSGKGGAKHPLMTSGQCWFRLFFSHLFQRCTALQETNVLHVLQKIKWRPAMTIHHQCSGLTFCTRHKWFQTLPYRKNGTNHWHTVGHWRRGYVLDLFQTQSQKGKKLENPAAEQLSSTEPACFRSCSWSFWKVFDIIIMTAC